MEVESLRHQRMVTNINSLLEKHQFALAVKDILTYLRNIDMFEDFEKEFIQALKERVVYELFLNITPETLSILRQLYPSQDVVILGDSHLRPLFDAPEIYRKAGIHPTLLTISGASVAGFGRAESTLQVFTNLVRFLHLTKPHCLLFKLGQVDIECGFYYKKFVKDKTLEMEIFISQLVEQYVHALQSLPDYGKCFVCGINLPAIFEQNRAIEYVHRIISANMDAETKSVCRDFLASELPRISERTEHAFMFNDKLKNLTSENAIQYIDFTDIFYDKSSHRLRSDVTGGDHHYACSESHIAQCADKLHSVCL